MDPSTSELARTHLAVSWLSALLYMLEITLAIYYLSRYTVTLPVKALLSGLILADSMCMLTVFASTWVVLIRTDPFEPFSSRESLWTVPLSTVMLTMLGVTEELFLINRCRKLAQPLAITLILLCMVLAHAILDLYSAFYVVTHTLLDPDFVRYGNKAAMISASIAATVDMFIPLALTWQLYRVSPVEISKQRSYRDVTLNAISSGGCGALLSFVLLIIFWTKPGVFYIFVNTMGRVYVITLLVNLLLSKRRTSSLTSAVEKVRRRSSVAFTSRTDIGLVILRRTGTLSDRASSIISDREKDLPPIPDQEMV